jgi:3-hydroxybutyryl-CoA dehydrogenase
MSSDIQTIGIIGAGQMGGGIAHVCAASGYDIYLIDQTENKVAAGLETLTRNMDRDVARGRMKESLRNSALKRIRTGLS